MSATRLGTDGSLYDNSQRSWYIACDVFCTFCWLFYMGLMLHSAQSQTSPPGCHLYMKDEIFKYEYSQDGDIIIGGIFTAHAWLRKWRYAWEMQDREICILPSFREYRHIMAFIFAIEELNGDPDILPNITVGYHLYDSCGNVNRAIKDVLQILSGTWVTAPNYSCMDHGTVAGFIGDLHSITSLPMAQLLGLYGYTQISYGAKDPTLSDRRLYPHFFRTLGSNEMQYAALVKFLLYFQWNMVCILTTNDDAGEQELRHVSKELTKSGICIELVFAFTATNFIDSSVMKKLKAEVVILCGTNNGQVKSVLAHKLSSIKNKTIIFLTSWSHDTDLVGSETYGTPINCSFTFRPLLYSFKVWEEKFKSMNPSTHPDDPILEDIWITTFNCLSRNTLKNKLLQRTVYAPLHNCSGKERFEDHSHLAMDELPYKVYMAVQMMARALHVIHKIPQRSKINKEDNDVDAYRRKVRHFMKFMCVNGFDNTNVCFNNKGEIPEPLMIINYMNEKGTLVHLQSRDVGIFDESRPPGQQMLIEPSNIKWINNKKPYSRCSKRCLPGFRKAVKGRTHICCYDCLSCAQGEISNKSDAENCEKCPSDEWPNETRVKCVSKTIDFLSYETDILAYVFSLLSVFSCTIIALIIGIFVAFRNTPVVRANNRNLSFIILISLKLSLLCMFLFIGKPVDTTCMFRHISFGILFTVVLSSILAKTIMVCIAFKATTPGSSWRTWVGVKLPNSIALTISSLQVMNGIFWLSFSPPFQELDMDTYPGKIIIQCNEGSRLAFYFMLGYMGLLAAVSLILAFMVRTLPDIYNEAKYITFSMLVFFSVWICAIPAYVSSKGKSAVSVEVFAILASGNGIVICMFLPKLWIVLTKPELRTRSLLQK